MLTLSSSVTNGTALLRLFIGTYTHQSSCGIYTSLFNAEQGTLEEPVLAAECDNPTFLAIHPFKPFLYAIGKFPKGMLRAFHYGKNNGALVPINEQEIPGHGPCHLAVCPSTDGQTDAVVVANYGSGSVVSFPISDDGKIGAAASQITHTGSGPNSARQQAPHVHGVHYDGSMVAAVDLGIDRVVFYRLDPVTAKLLQPVDRADLQLPPGAGPRHCVASKDQQFLYVVNELDSTVSVFDWRMSESRHPIQSVSTLTAEKETGELHNTAAEIALHPNGNFLYASNRGDDSIAVFAVDSEVPLLIQNAPSGGKTPRFFCLDPTGRFLLACNQDSGNICVLAVDLKTGMLTPTGRSVAVSQPACLVFAR